MLLEQMSGRSWGLLNKEMKEKQGKEDKNCDFEGG